MMTFELSGAAGQAPHKNTLSGAYYCAGQLPDNIRKKPNKSDISDCPAICPALSVRYQMPAVCPVGVSLGHPTPDTRTTAQTRRIK